jgi:hypothetical protein
MNIQNDTILTVRPGPVLHVWQGGKEVARVSLTLSSALNLVRDVLAKLNEDI